MKIQTNEIIVSNILLIIISDSKKGGAQKNLLRCLPYFTFNIVVICPSGWLFDELTKVNCTVIKYNRLTILFTVLNVIKNHNISLVNTQLLEAAFLASIIRTLKKFNLFVTINNKIIYDNLGFVKKTLYPIVYRIINKKCIAFTPKSESLKNELIELGIDNEKIFTIYNGISLSDFKFNERFSIHKNDIAIGMIGRLTYQKGHEYGLMALPEIKKHFPNVKLLIAGSGEQEKYLKYRCKALGLKKSDVEFLGYITDLKSFYNKINILLFPSLWEGFPNTILEAIASGIPVVSTEVNGVSEIDLNNIIFINKQDPVDISIKVIDILNGCYCLEKMRFQAFYNIKANYEIQKVVADIENIYRKVTNH